MPTLRERRTDIQGDTNYVDHGEIRGQQYRQGDFVQIVGHEHANGGELEQFIFKALDVTHGTVDVWQYEHVKGGIATNQCRSFKLERVRTDIELGELKMAKRAAKTDKAKAARTPKVGVCEYTGGATKGGRFQPGRDAALKGALLAGAREGDANRAAELIARGWPTKDVDKTVLVEGKKRQAADPEGFVTKQVNARLAKVAKGTDPWEAASGLKLEAA